MKFLKSLLLIVPLFFFTLALYLIHAELGASSWFEIKAELREWPRRKIEIASLLCALNFLILSGYDVVGLKFIGAKLRYFRTLKISFYAFSLSNLVGHSLFSGTSVRMRYYVRENIGLAKIAQMSVQNTLALWLGFFALASFSLLAYPELGSSVHVGSSVTFSFGFFFAACVISILLLAAFSTRRTLSFRERLSLDLPDFSSTLAYLVLSVLDLVVCAATLFVLLPAGTQLGFPHFLALFIVAQLAGLLSQIPGGLGIFEGIFVALLTPFAPVHSLLTSLVLFRVIYYFAPFAITLIGVVHDEVVSRRPAARKATRIVQVLLSPLVAQLFSVATFAGGVLLLFSGVFPAVRSRATELHHVLPLYVMEFSHLASSLTGFSLLLLSFELWGKNRRALHLVQIFLGIGIASSILKGLDYEEAIILVFVLFVSYFARGAFYRKKELALRRISGIQIVAVFLLLLLTIYAGLFAYQEVPYNPELWIKFHVHGDAERFLRSSLAIFVFFSFLVLRSYLKSTSIAPIGFSSPESAKAVEEILAHVSETDAQLVWLGDKHVLLSGDKKAFLMFGIQGRSWIVLGDVYGEENSRRQLLQTFVDQADRDGFKPVFYQIGEKSLALMLESGLQVFKLGEEAHIDLQKFSLEGKARSSLRASKNKGEKEDLIFRIIARPEVPLVLPRLRTISDAWIAEKNAKEKGFSLGYFREDYVSKFPCAVLEKDGVIVAFANLWLGAGKEMSLDLMRYDPALAPKGSMDFLFIKILLWGRDQKFQTFNFGMAPLSGLRSNPWGPLWYRLGSFIYRHGENFYNFQGLRDYKEKYDPIWKMRFIAAPGGVSFLRTLTDVTLLIGGGALGVLGFGKGKK